MRKIISLFLVLVIVLTMLSACGSKKPMDIVKEGHLGFNTNVTIDEMAQSVLIAGAADQAYYEDVEVDGIQYTNLYFEMTSENMSLCLSFQHGENETFSLYDLTATDSDGLVHRMDDEDSLEIMTYLYSLVQE